MKSVALVRQFQGINSTDRL